MAIQQAIVGSLANSSIVARTLVVTLIIFYIITRVLGLDNYKYITIQPATVFSQFKVWTFFTAGFVEPHFVQLIVDICGTFFIDSIVFPLWGKQEWIRFLVMVLLISNFITTLVTYVHFLIFKVEGSLDVPFFGYNAFQASFNILLWQLKPEQKIIVGPITLPIRFRLLPMIYLNGISLGSTLGFLPFTDLVLSFVGMHFAWAYLRFFQRIDGSRGDSSESFSYLALLPEFLRPYIRPLFCHIHNAASQLGVLPTGQFQPIIPLNTNEKVEVSQIDRHRQLGLQALNDRMNEPN